jgi:ABC-type nickel/cobalt efflux system permease component RcnA
VPGEQVGSAGAIGLTLGLSLLHAALPNHWFPFVIVGRAQRWSRRKTLGVLAAAGGGHVVATSALGLVVWKLGATVLGGLSEENIHRTGAWIAGGLLIALGIFFIARQALGKHGHSHAHAAELYHGHEGDHPHGHEGDHPHDDHGAGPPGVAGGAPAMTDRAAIVTLLLALTFSPCEAVVAAFLSGVRFGLDYVLVIAIGTSLVTVSAMFALTWLTLAGRERLRFGWLDRNEMALTGWILVAIGVVVLLVPT